jgi:hypothetical protein
MMDRCEPIISHSSFDRRDHVSALFGVSIQMVTCLVVQSSIHTRRKYIMCIVAACFVNNGVVSRYRILCCWVLVSLEALY